MPLVRQLSIFLANEPKTLVRVCEALAEKGINIKALSVIDTVDHAVVRFILSDPMRGQEVLEDANVFVVDNRVHEVRLASRPGALAELAGRLGDSNLNIDYAYGSTTADNQGVLYIRTNDPERAEEVLSNFESA